MIGCKSVCKKLGASEVLRNVSISLDRGQGLSLIGPNGGGKTMLLQSLALTVPPDSGLIEVDGVQFHFPTPMKGNPTPLWPKVAVIFQQLYDWPHLKFGEAFDMLSKGRSESRAYLRQVLERLEVASLVQRYPHQCSLGQRQRLAIVRSVMLRPDYLLADEPTAALDIHGALAVGELFNDLKRNGTGILIVTHQLGLAAHLADKVGFMKDGELLEYGDATLLRNPRTEATKEFINLMTTR